MFVLPSHGAQGLDPVMMLPQISDAFRTWYYKHVASTSERCCMILTADAREASLSIDVKSCLKGHLGQVLLELAVVLRLGLVLVLQEGLAGLLALQSFHALPSGLLVPAQAPRLLCNCIWVGEEGL